MYLFISLLYTFRVSMWQRKKEIVRWNTLRTATCFDPSGIIITECAHQMVLYGTSNKQILCPCDHASWETLITKPTRCTNFSNFFWNDTLRVSDNSFVHFQDFFTAIFYETNRPMPHQQQNYTSSVLILILLASCQHNLYDIYHRCGYSEKLLMMDRGTVRNM